MFIERLKTAAKEARFRVICNALGIYLGINLTWILMSTQSPFFKSRN